MKLHTHFQQGKRVFVVLRNGMRFIARYYDQKSNFVNFLDHDSVKKSEIRSMIINKNV